MRGNFSCSHCKVGDLHPRLLAKLVLAEDILIFHHPLDEIVITSGHRCKAHNKAVGGIKNSFHTKNPSPAVDITCDNLFSLYIILERLGFEGLLYYRDRKFIHADIAEGKKRPQRALVTGWKKDRKYYYYKV